CSAATALGLAPPSSVGGLGCFWRKLSFGTQSEQGSRFVETLLATIETCRQQNRSVIDHVTQTLEAHFHKQTPPSLLTKA
ncbi:MAG: IS66 family transposase, partial [Planctomycetaceae bacterium]